MPWRSPVKDAEPPRDSQSNSNPSSTNLNWLPPQSKSAAVERWPIPVSQAPPTAPPANDRGSAQVGDGRPRIVQPTDQTSAAPSFGREPDARRESIYVYSDRSPQPRQPVDSQSARARPIVTTDTTIQRQSATPPVVSAVADSSPRRLPPVVSAMDPGAPREPARLASWPESALRPLPPVGNSNTFFTAPAAQNNNYVRPTSYPSDSGSAAQPWPATELRLLPPVQSTDYANAPSDPQRPSATQSLPPTSKIQPLPPVNSPLERLPPVGP
ncbi:MAG TPA: hypothetical protein VG056_16410 [Pirellulales bacterium]|jgi:hypothetical protein|nr:hypothetical protein [Pirellulales bacterium]